MATTKAKPAGDASKGLKVTARADHFRRAGHVFTGEARVIPLSDLTDEQVEQLKTEPMLVVQDVDIKPEPEGKK